jgi:hypothetical protein
MRAVRLTGRIIPAEFGLTEVFRYWYAQIIIGPDKS